MCCNRKNCSRAAKKLPNAVSSFKSFNPFDCLGCGLSAPQNLPPPPAPASQSDTECPKSRQSRRLDAPPSEGMAAGRERGTYRFARNLPTILPLPFRRGEGRGEGSVFALRSRGRGSRGFLPSSIANWYQKCRPTVKKTAWLTKSYVPSALCPENRAGEEEGLLPVTVCAGP